MNEWYQDTVDQRILFATTPDDVAADRFVFMRVVGVLALVVAVGAAV